MGCKSPLLPYAVAGGALYLKLVLTAKTAQVGVIHFPGVFRKYPIRVNALALEGKFLFLDGTNNR